jgi:hypothetical protein
MILCLSFFAKRMRKLLNFSKVKLWFQKKFIDIERDSKPVLSNIGSVSFTNEKHHNSEVGSIA